MPKKEYIWSPNSVPDIAPHSLAKHRILNEYVKRYLQVLTAQHGMERFRITLVDGFAGGGLYHNPLTGLPHPGSPQILLDAVREAEIVINSSRSKKLQIDAKFVFVEKERDVLEHLRSVLLRREDLSSENYPLLLEGKFEDHLNSIIARIKASNPKGRVHRAIFVLDQYGYTQVSPNILSCIFDQLPHAEVFLTIAVGWITPYLQNNLSVVQRLGLSQKMIDELTINPDYDLDLSDMGQRPDLAAIQRILHYMFTGAVGSRFYTPFFIKSRESNRPIWFLHIANNDRAHDVVKTLHWEFENHFEHLGGSGLMMLGYDPDVDPMVTGQLGFAFDNDAKKQTQSSLRQELPKRIYENYRSGIEFGDLFQKLCNETPATKAIMGKAISELCIEGYLEKSGGEGERRAPSTMPHDDDLIKIPAQTTFFLPR